MKADTGALKKIVEEIGQVVDDENTEIRWITAYHLSRCGDALERIASHLENGQLSLLREEDLIQALRNISASRY